MKHLIALVFSLFAAVASAQMLADGWTDTGKLDLTVGGKRMPLRTMIGPDGHASATVVREAGSTKITVEAAAIGRRGEPELPIVTIVIGPYTGERLPAEARFAMNLGDGAMIADGSTGPLMKLSFPRLSDGRLTFSIEGVAYISDDTGGIPTPFKVSGRYAGEVTAQ